MPPRKKTAIIDPATTTNATDAGGTGAQKRKYRRRVTGSRTGHMINTAEMTAKVPAAISNSIVKALNDLTYLGADWNSLGFTPTQVCNHLLGNLQDVV